jgi:hypothetical protein
VSRCLVKVADKPVILAGGPNPENVKRAILEVRPAGVDSHTGVEDSSGRKSREKVSKFLSEAYEGFESLKQSSDDHQSTSTALRDQSGMFRKGVRCRTLGRIARPEPVIYDERLKVFLAPSMRRQTRASLQP